MKFPHFFIDRPIFAAVLSILIVIVGAVAYPSLPIAQYPNIAPPTVVVTASYPGASAETVAETVPEQGKSGDQPEPVRGHFHEVHTSPINQWSLPKSAPPPS